MFLKILLGCWHSGKGSAIKKTAYSDKLGKTINLFNFFIDPFALIYEIVLKDLVYIFFRIEFIWVIRFIEIIHLFYNCQVFRQKTALVLHYIFHLDVCPSVIALSVCRFYVIGHKT